MSCVECSALTTATAFAVSSNLGGSQNVAHVHPCACQRMVLVRPAVQLSFVQL